MVAEEACLLRFWKTVEYGEATKETSPLCEQAIEVFHCCYSFLISFAQAWRYQQTGWIDVASYEKGKAGVRSCSFHAHTLWVTSE